MEPQRLYPAWHGRSATLAARRLARLNYSRTVKTDEGYLPLPKRASTLDPERGAANLIGNYATICALIAEHAEHSIPSTFDSDPNRACIAWECSFLFGHAQEWSTVHPSDRRTFRQVLASLKIEGILTVDEWTSAPMIAEALAGQILGEATANSPAQKVLSTTQGHKQGLDGTYRTFRSSMPIIDTYGNRDDAVTLVRMADQFLKSRSDDGQLGDFALIGTQDIAGGDLNAGATARYGANGELRKACPAGHGDGDPSVWHVLQTVDYVATEKGGKFIPTWKAIDAGNRFNERGQLTYRGTDGRTDDTRGRSTHLKIRSAGYRHEDGSVHKVTCKCGAALPPKTMQAHDVRGWGIWQTLNAYRMTYDGKRFDGHVRTDRRTCDVNKPTTRRARVARVKVKPTPINATDAPEHCAELAMAMYNAHVSTHVQTEDPRATPKRFKLQTENGTRIDIGITPRGYDVVIVDSVGKRKRTSTTAPEYVEAIVRNRLALIG